MLDRDEIRKNLEDWMGNPFWAEYYNGAPSEKCREFVAMELYYSETENEEAGEAMDAVEAVLEIPDLRWLMDHCGNNPRKKFLHDRIEALGGAG